jgi:two-component system sensor histidine kinase/response regulator
MDEYLSKPIRREQLFDVIERLVSGESASAVSETAAQSQGGDGEVLIVESLLAVVGDDRELLAGVIETFREDSAAIAQQIQEAFERGDAETVERAAHKLKGSSGTLAAREVAGIAGRIEVLAAEKKLADAAALIARLPHSLKRLESALSAAAQS